MQINPDTLATTLFRMNHELSLVVYFLCLKLRALLMANSTIADLFALCDNSWKRELAHSFKKPLELLEYLEIDVSKAQSCFGEVLLDYNFPMLVTKHFVSLMQKGNINDKLLLQVLPFSNEAIVKEGFVSQPLAEQENFLAQPNIVHKYDGRLLYLPKGACAINCRYCFRRNFPYELLDSGSEAMEHSLDYIYANNISEVILSGGDPLMMNDREFIELAQALVQRNEQATIRGQTAVARLRIHSRLPVVLPARINQAFKATCGYLQEHGIRVCMVFHINHTQEISSELQRVCWELHQVGVTLLNQSVLLANINDTVTQQCQLAQELFASHILPYYLHLFDKVAGASHFYVDDETATTIYNAMQAQLPGYLLPRLVREEVGKNSKTLIIPSVNLS